MMPFRPALAWGHGQGLLRLLLTGLLASRVFVFASAPSISADYQIEWAGFDSGAGVQASADYRGDVQFSDFGSGSDEDSPGSTDYATAPWVPAGQNAAPTVTGQSLTLDAGSTIELRVEATDPDGDSLRWTVVEGPVLGTLSGDLPLIRYASVAGRVGVDRFRVRVADPDGATAEAVIEVTLRAAAPAEPDLKMAITPEGLVIQGAAAPGTYRVEASEDLITWIDLDRVEATGGGVRWVVSATGGPRYRFYRLRPDSGGPAPFRVQIARTGGGPGPVVDVSAVVEAGTYRLEASADLSDWNEIARQTVERGTLRFQPPAVSVPGHQFFRILREP